MAKAAPSHRNATIGKRHTSRKRHQATDERRGSARERGYTTAWDKFSKAFIRRNPLCEYCLGNGKTAPATVTDHDIPHEGDPELFWGNTFTALCTACHSGTKQRLEARYADGALLREIARLKATAPRR